MLPILRDYLVESATVEALDCIERAHNVFDRFQYDAHEFEFEQLLMNESQTERSDLVPQIFNLTEDFQAVMLLEHGVTLTSEANIEFNTAILDALLNIADSEDKQTITDILSTPASTEEKFAELMALFVDESPEEIMVKIELVSDSLLTRIGELAQPEEEATDPELEAKLNKCRARVARFVTFNESFPGIAKEVFDSGVDAGYPLTLYLNIVKDKIPAATAEHVANSLICFALASIDASDSPELRITEVLESYVFDPLQITSIVIALKNRLMEFNHYETT